MVLVDSSVWIDLLRARSTPAVDTLRTLLAVDEAALAPVIYQEILQGATSSRHFKKLRDYFGTLPFLVPSHDIGTYAAAAEMYVTCRARGITPRSPHDCLVACIAIEHGVALLQDDRDFEAIARANKSLVLYQIVT